MGPLSQTRPAGTVNLGLAVIAIDFSHQFAFGLWETASRLGNRGRLARAVVWKRRSRVQATASEGSWSQAAVTCPLPRPESQHVGARRAQKPAHLGFLHRGPGRTGDGKKAQEAELGSPDSPSFPTSTASPAQSPAPPSPASLVTDMGVSIPLTELRIVTDHGLDLGSWEGLSLEVGGPGYLLASKLTLGLAT